VLIVAASTVLSIMYFSDKRVDPVDMRGIREVSNNVILLGFSAIKETSGFELKDRTVAHFNINPLIGDVSGSTLNIGVLNLDPEPPPGTIDVYLFAGDGTVSTDELTTGGLFHSLSGLSGAVQTLTVDISALVTQANLNGDRFLSFNLRASDSDRYSLQSTIGGVTQISGIQSAGKAEGPTFIEHPNPIVLKPGRLALLGVVCHMGIGLVIMRIMGRGRCAPSKDSGLRFYPIPRTVESTSTSSV
jgi:hypothetical protein